MEGREMLGDWDEDLREPMSQFLQELRPVLHGKAESKGYREGHDPRPGGELHTFVERHFEGHALGEVVYKAVRAQARHDPEDLLKIAAWAFLVWSRTVGMMARQPPTGSMERPESPMNVYQVNVDAARAKQREENRENRRKSPMNIGQQGLHAPDCDNKSIHRAPDDCLVPYIKG